MRAAKLPLVWVLFFAAVSAFSSRQLFQIQSWRFPSLRDLPMSEFYGQDLGAIMLGSHRIAADLAYIQLLQYYGVRQEDDEHDHDHGHDHAHVEEGWTRPRTEFEAGHYPLLKEKAQRLMRLDPFFNAAILETAGSLAFIELKIQDGLDILAEAITRDPSYFRYHLYVTALLYKNEGQDEKLIEKLQEALKFNDCPPLLQGVLGNLLKKKGHYNEAAMVYLHMVLNAVTEGDRDTALRRLKKLMAERPEVIPAIQNRLPPE